MNYRIALLTHGPDAVAHDTLRSFLDNVTPAPSDVMAWGDGPASRWPLEQVGAVCEARDLPYSYGVGDRPRGFCEATRELWKRAAFEPRPGTEGLQLSDHVFWLEHDFMLLRPLDLTPLAAILAHHRIYGGDPVAQVSLMRGPANDLEGDSLVQSRPGEFHDEGRWLSHRAYFTTNPMLMTVDFMLAEPWPDDGEPQCEGRYGIELFGRGYRAGVWGGGEAWVDHVGQRTGVGY